MSGATYERRGPTDFTYLDKETMLKRAYRICSIMKKCSQLP